MNLTRTPPEEAVVDAVLADPLGAEMVLAAIARSPAEALRQRLLDDIARKEDLASDRLERLLAALQSSGVIHIAGDRWELTVSASDALRYAAVLRGVAYAQHRHRDANTVEITLSPPASPSRLMERLPKAGFSWARLYDTKDSLIELACRSHWRFVVVTPFVDDEGLQWVGALFEGARNATERVLIVRGWDQADVDALRLHTRRCLPGMHAC